MRTEIPGTGNNYHDSRITYYTIGNVGWRIRLMYGGRCSTYSCCDSCVTPTRRVSAVGQSVGVAMVQLPIQRHRVAVYIVTASRGGSSREGSRKRKQKKNEKRKKLKSGKKMRTLPTNRNYSSITTIFNQASAAVAAGRGGVQRAALCPAGGENSLDRTHTTHAQAATISTPPPILPLSYVHTSSKNLEFLFRRKF